MSGFNRRPKTITVAILVLLFLGVLIPADKGMAAFVDRSSVADGTMFSEIESGIRTDRLASAQDLLEGNSLALQKNDTSRYHYLRGFLRFKRGQFGAAVVDLRKAAEASRPQTPSDWFLLLGRAAAGARDYPLCRTGFQSASAWQKLAAADGAAFAGCLEALGEYETAWDVLQGLGPNDGESRRIIGLAKGRFLMGRHLYEQSRRLFAALWNQGDMSRADLFDVARQFRDQNRCSDAIELLASVGSNALGAVGLQERARCQLALLDHEGAANSLAELSLFDGRYLEETAELFKRAGRPQLALVYNERLEDSAAKVRQRFGLLLDAGDHDGALSLLPFLQKWDLMEQDEVRYGLAYANFQIGEVAEMERFLSGIRRADLARKATELRKRVAQRQPSGTFTQ